MEASSVQWKQYVQSQLEAWRAKTWNLLYLLDQLQFSVWGTEQCCVFFFISSLKFPLAQWNQINSEELFGS